MNDSTSVVPRRSEGEDNKEGRNEDQKRQVAEAPRMYSAEEIATSRKEVNEEATRYVHDVYSLLIEDLGLTLSQKEALISLLIEAEIAATRTAYSSGEGMDEQELSNRIAAIMGDSKLQQFLALDRYRAEYAEAQKVRTLLEQNDAPLTDTQVDDLLTILVDVRNQVDTQLPADIAPGSMDSLEYRLDEMDLYERLVLELAPSILTARQVNQSISSVDTQAALADHRYLHPGRDVQEPGHRITQLNGSTPCGYSPSATKAPTSAIF